MWMKEMMKVGEGAYRLTGYFQNLEPESADTDYWALDHGFASITPVQLDMTAYSLFDELKSLQK
jgi:5'-nucleotidase